MEACACEIVVAKWQLTGKNKRWNIYCIRLETRCRAQTRRLTKANQRGTRSQKMRL
jgi:hypothetical protein